MDFDEALVGSLSSDEEAKASRSSFLAAVKITLSLEASRLQCPLPGGEVPSGAS
jgi:hypothetical protein